MLRIKKKKEIENQFNQVVQSFFSMNPTKGEDELLCYVELESNLEYKVFMEWRYKEKFALVNGVWEVV